MSEKKTKKEREPKVGDAPRRRPDAAEIGRLTGVALLPIITKQQKTNWHIRWLWVTAISAAILAWSALVLALRG